MEHRCDVLVVGAGPTGLTLANLLGQQGLSVLVAERNAATVGEPRAVSIDDESLRTLQAAGVIDEVLTQVVPGYGSRYLTPAGRCFLTVLPTGRPYGYPRRNAFRQPILEEQLRRALDRHPSVEAKFGSEVLEFDQDEDGVVVRIRDRDGDGTVRARFMVGCDGASSSIRKALGSRMEGRTLPERWLIVDLKNSPAERDTLVFCDPARPCIALPGPEGTRRFEFKLFGGEDDAEMLRTETVQALLAWRGAAPESEIVRQTVYTFHARIADRWSKGRVFLAGDAAHLTPPFAGQGMNSGIRDAHNLAWKLAEVVAGRLAPELLATYEVERRGHVQNMIDLALRMGRIMGPATRVGGWLMQSAFSVAGLWPALRAYLGEMRYKPSPHFPAGFLLQPAAVLVGRLLPQPLVATGGGADQLLDAVLPPGFVLLGVDISLATVENVARSLPTGKVPVSARALSLGITTPSGDRRPRAIAPTTALSAAAGKLLLVRPDRYVMAAFAPDEVAGATPQLAKLFRTDGPLVTRRTPRGLMETLDVPC